MRKTFLFFLILPLALFAAEGNETDAALDKIGEKVKDLKTFTANFRQLDKDPLFMDESEHKGKLSFMRTVKDGVTNCFLRFDYLEPEKSVTIITPTGVFLYTDDMTEPQFSPSRDGNRADLAFAVFQSSDTMNRHYDVTVNKESGKKHSFKLIPKSDFAKSFFSEAEADFSDATGFPERLRQVKLNGQDITIYFSDHILNAPVASNYFDASSLKKTK